MNAIALDVPDAVFKATHFPSFVQQQGARRGTFVPLRETEFLDDFLNDDHVHVFNIAVGDTGTGKSHLIRWMDHEVRRRNRMIADRYWVVLIPRSSANLADVVRRILQGFEGQTTTRLINELNQHRALPFSEAKNRVIDELSYALETNDADLYRAERQRTPEEAEILKALPALLRAQELRKILTDRPAGIVTRVARHVLGRREDFSEEKNLHWTPDDLKFGVRESERAGKEASELAMMLLQDDRARDTAAGLLNLAQRAALKSLLRFRSGDMKEALVEIRRDLLRREKELVVLIEDLSVTEGLDAELVEALQVRTRDTGEELCRLRSIVGVTNEDYARIRDNIAEGRTLRTLFFNMTVGDASHDGTVERGAVLDFASRYLNAARHPMAELETWYEDAADEPLSSVCDACPNLRPCHEAFGAIDGRGLYPLSAEAIPRLYDRAASGRGESDRAFNPRLLVVRVLSGVLEEAEQSVEAGTFPRGSLTSSFALEAVRADVQLGLRAQFGAEADRLQRAIDLYAVDPSSAAPEVASGICRAFDLPILTGKSVLAASPSPSEPLKAAEPAVSVLDQFDRWFRGERLPDADLNRWRVAVHGAVRAWIDWDAPGLASVKTRFKPASIRFEGQFTRQKTDITLLIARTAEDAIALRALVGRFGGASEDVEKQIRAVRRQVAQWSHGVIVDLQRFLSESGDPDPVSLAAEFLTMGALIRGAISSRSSDVDLLRESFVEWPLDGPVSRSPEWMSLWNAYRRFEADARNLLRGALALTKGGVSGAIVDPSRVLSGMRYVRAHGRTHQVPEGSTAWVQYEPVARLAKEVAIHIDAAAVSERQACEDWLTKTRQWFGDGDPIETFAAIKRAFATADSVGRVRLGGVQNFTAQLAAVSSRPVPSAFAEAGRAVSATEPAVQIGALARLDRGLMADIEAFCGDASRVLGATAEGLEDAIRETGHDADPAVVEGEIRSLTTRIATNLKEMGEGRQ